MRSITPLLLTAITVGSLAAQSNTVPGLDGRLTTNASPTSFGRRGTFPNGETGMSYSYTMCNPGTASIPWTAPMNPLHPMFSYMVARESNGRIEQINNDKSYVKHAFGAANSSSTCGTCTAAGTGLRVGCSDTYGASLNANRFYLGPPSEIDPWTGIWNPVGSYFDRGDPDVGSPGNTDGGRSLTSGTTGVFVDGVLNRVTLKDQDLLVPGRLFYGMYIVVTGEDGDLHFDNLGHTEMTATWTGTAWTFANGTAGFTQGSVLQKWSGARINSARNGEDDGHFIVASKVTPISGGFHYEYAIHNLDNARGGAALRIPVAAGATVSNLGFRDNNDNALDQWTAARVGNEVQFLAPPGNPLNWNNLYNFWFDCTQAPSQGLVNVDEARVGPGGLQVSVIADVPSGVPTAFNTSVGTGCAGGTGPCTATVFEQFPNGAAFDLANSSMGFTFNGTNYTMGPASGTYTAPTGTTLPLIDDSELSIVLPFTLSYPGGSAASLWVGSNGYVGPVSNGTSFAVSGSAFAAGGPRWAAAWRDLNPAAGGSVQWSSSPTAVRVSFTNVPVFGATGTSSLTFQYEFLSTNQVNVYWQTMTTTGTTPYLAGWTAGNDTSNPPSSNLSAIIPLANTQLCPGAQNLQVLTLAAGSRPVLGTTVNMTTSNIPAGSLGQALLYGPPTTPPIDLTSVGMAGCLAYLSSFDIFAITVAPGVTVVNPVAIPNTSSLSGVTVVMQAASHSPPRTAFGWLSSNGIAMSLAAQ